ncbi:hypothetical protein QE152_g40742, partial [Popillia japonica]
MDNAPYHSVKSEKLPTATWKKDALVNWLLSKGILCDNTQLKIELLDLTKLPTATWKKDALVNWLLSKADVKVLLQEGLDLVNAESWKNCVKHAIAEEDKMYQVDNIVENMVEEFIITV